MSSESGFLTAISDEGDADTSRLVFADWLEEHDEPERAELIRVQCELARWVPEIDRREALQEREAQLIAAHARSWLSPISRRCKAWKFHDGTAHLTFDAKTFLGLTKRQLAAFDRGVIQRVRLEGCSGRVAKLAACPTLALVAELDLSGNDFATGELSELLGSPHLAGLRGLDLSNVDLQEKDWRSLKKLHKRASLTWVEVRNCHASAADHSLDIYRELEESIPRLRALNGTRPGWTYHRPPTPWRPSGRPGELFWNYLGMVFACIPAGSFWMGAPDDENGAFANEKPRHRVRLTRPFFLGVFTVNQHEFCTVVHRNPSLFTVVNQGGNDYPVENVTWDAAVEFCRLLSEKEHEKKAGRVYRLPTEAEWEYACRAGTTTPFHFGDSASSYQANFSGGSPYGKARKGPFLQQTLPGGAYLPNAFGLFDVHGNVWEWVNDFYDPDYYHRSPEVDPPGPESGQTHVLRGGSWFIVGRGCRSAERCYTDEAPVQRPGTIGFRIAVDQH